MDLNVKVAVRCRPMSSKENARGCQSIITINGNSIHIKSVDAQREDRDFTFDHCYDSSSTQLQVYSELGKPVVSQALDGFNGTIFAYGQTGSGKTYSMMGSDDDKGIIPQLNDDLWNLINQKLHALTAHAGDDNEVTKVMVTVSFLEVYNEEIKDLLNPSDKKLQIHEHPTNGIYVEGLYESIVRDSGELVRLIYQGNAVRRVASTNMNDQSSRSHSVFTIKVEQKTTSEIAGGLTREQTIKAKINLVDLAGSERASKTGAEGTTLKEGANINLSLMALGNVINALSETTKKGKKVIPYRSSKLTRLLQESLGGNSATVMIASISPADYNYSETVSTLKYANRAKCIANAVTRNEDSNEKMIRELQAQIEALKLQLQSDGSANGTKINGELERKLKEMEESKRDAWEEKERLYRALEEERQANMNAVISSMMHDVKEQKVHHMKTIKRLTNEKALLTKNFKDCKDANTALKPKLDSDIGRYQDLQKDYDDLMASNFNGGDTAFDKLAQERRNQEAEGMANEMMLLLAKIETDRLKYSENRDALKRMKERLEAIDEEITDARAELVATNGLLTQNDKIREQIQQEEREKVRLEFESELNKAKEQLDEEREKVREVIHSELAEEMEALKSQIKKFKAQLKLEENKNAELVKSFNAAQEYSETLVQRLADSEVALEVSQAEAAKLQFERDRKEEDIQRLLQENQLLHEEVSAARREAQEMAEQQKKHSVQATDEEKYQLFRSLMDTFNEERRELERKHAQTQSLLAQAAKDVMFLSQKNQELTAAYNQAILYEPNIKHH